MGANDILNAVTKLKFHIRRSFVCGQYSPDISEKDQSGIRFCFATLMEKKFTTRFFFLRKSIVCCCLDGKK